MYYIYVSFHFEIFRYKILQFGNLCNFFFVAIIPYIDTYCMLNK